MFVKNDNRILQKLLRQTVLSNKAANVWQLRIHFNSSGGTLDEETAVILQLSHNCLTKKCSTQLSDSSTFANKTSIESSVSSLMMMHVADIARNYLVLINDDVKLLCHICFT